MERRKAIVDLHATEASARPHGPLPARGSEPQRAARPGGALSFGLFTSLDVDSATHGAPSPADRIRFVNVLEQARLADALGFDRFLVAENHVSRANGICPAPVAVLSAAAAVTRRIELGPAVALLPLHNPVDLASTYAVLDNLSDGRLFMGVGSGISEASYRAFGVPFDERDIRFRETLEVFNHLLHGDTVGSTGRFFEFPPVRLNVAVSRRKQMWVACGRLPSIKTILGLGHGVLFSPFITRANRAAMAAMLAELAGAGIEVPANLHLMLHVHIRDDAHEAWTVASGAMRNRLAQLRAQSIPGGLPDRAAQGYLRRARADGQLLFSNSCGARDALLGWQRMGLRQFLLMMDFGGLPHRDVVYSMRLFMEEVAPAFSNSAAVGAAL